MSDRPIRSTQEVILDIAGTALATHELTEEQGSGPVRMWLCRKPRDSAYSFRVILFPGTIVVAGDIGDAILNVNERDPLVWLDSVCDPGRATDYRYLLEKNRTAEREYCRRAAARSLAASAKELDLDPSVVARVCVDDEYELRETIPDEIDLSEFDCYDYPSGAYWTCEALRCFIRLRVAQATPTTQTT